MRKLRHGDKGVDTVRGQQGPLFWHREGTTAYSRKEAGHLARARHEDSNDEHRHHPTGQEPRGLAGHGYQGDALVCALKGELVGAYPLCAGVHCVFMYSYSVPEAWPGQSQLTVPVWLHPTI